MKLHAFISGLPEPLADGPLLLVVAVGIWLALVVISDRRHKSKCRAYKVDSFVELSSADRRRQIVAAAQRINLDLGSMQLPPSPGAGYNKNLVPGREGIVGYTDYDPDIHSPRDIDDRRFSPRGVPQVPLVQEPHENVVMIVVDVNQIDLAGGPDDELTKLETIRDLAATAQEWGRQNNHLVGLLATRGQQPIYLKPGSPVGEISEAIQRFQPGDNPDQSQALRRLAVNYCQRAKVVFVISHFDSDDSQGLIRQLPDAARKIAVHPTSQWQRQIDGLPAGQFDFEFADDAVARFDTVRDDKAYRRAAEKDLNQVTRRTGRGNVAYCRVHLDQPDHPGQMVTAANHGFRD